MNVQVLLSTFNGEKFIGDQIESILSQSYKSVSLLIRDDGSQDNTVRYVESYKDKFPERIELIKGSNVGVVESFKELLRRADVNCSFYSFCDQDDIWLNHKIESAVMRMRQVDENLALLFFTSTYLTDSELNKIKIWPEIPKRPKTFYNALIENIAVGTTITINKTARELITSKQPSTDHVIMHDWWFYLCVSAFGKVIYDETPTVLYRQHANNLVGGNKTIIDILYRKFKSYSTNKGMRILHKQALEFMECYGAELPKEKQQELDLFLSPRNSVCSRIQYLRRSKLYRQSFHENLLFKFLVIIGYV